MESHPTLEKSRGQARSLADRFVAAQQEIIDAWTAAVRADPAIRTDDSLSYAEFIDHIPHVLTELCRVLKGAPLEDEKASIRSDARVHGAFRWRQGYDLGELMREISHLRAVLLAFVTRIARECGYGPLEIQGLGREVLRVLDEGQVATILTYVSERDRELAERDRQIGERDRQIAEQERELQLALLEQERRRSEALESAARAKDEFLAILSHELRTPLTPLLAWTTILEKDPDATNVRAAAQAIGRNARVLVQLIDDLLDVSRIVSGKFELTRDSLDARAFVRTARDTVLPQAAAKGVSLVLDEPSEPLPVVGDAIRLQQVVWNLLSNAVKFSRPGGEVRITVGRKDGAVGIAVEDDGAGIDPEFLPHVFDRFRQQDQRSTRYHGGLGLGLAIARAIGEAHGGRLTAHSDGVGRGSRFELWLPLGETTPAAAAERDGRERRPRVPSSFRVMLIGGEPESRMALAAMLQQLGCDTRVAESAEQALDAALGWTPQCLLVDVGPPGSGSAHLLARLRAAPALAQASKIALSSYAMDADVDRLREAGFDHQLAKPVTLDQLEQALAMAAAPDQAPTLDPGRPVTSLHPAR